LIFCVCVHACMWKRERTSDICTLVSIVTIVSELCVLCEVYIILHPVCCSKLCYWVSCSLWGMHWGQSKQLDGSTVMEEAKETVVMVETVYEGCPESIQPFWISWEPVVWPWCNLAASPRRPYCAFVNSHSPVRLVGQQWGAVDRACVLCDFAFTMTERANQLHHDNAPAHSTALVQAFLAKHHLSQVCQPPYSPDLALCNFWLFPKLKSPLKGRRFLNVTVTQYISSFTGVSLPTD
jgi:hypothetical protein